MNWLPTFCIYGTTLCADDVSDFDGWTLSIVWRRWCVELVVARRSDDA